MTTLVLLFATILCALNWLACKAEATGMIRYMRQKGYRPPSERETKEYINEVVSEWLHRK